jgi:hypothetical protein
MMAYSTARRFITGRTPGWAEQIGQVCVFGSAPKTAASQPQNILERVASWT